MEFFFFLFSVFSIIGIVWIGAAIMLVVFIYLIVNRLNESKKETFEKREN